MENISLDKTKQKKLVKRVKNIKKNIKSGQIKIEEKPQIKKKKVKKVPKWDSKARGVIYIGHIPHGFYEDEMNGFFSQFGKVITAVVARSKKTARSKGFGFVVFKNEEVAKIAAETMNNYLMYNRILKCRYIPSEERKGKFFHQNFLNSVRKKNCLKACKSRNESFLKLNKSNYLKKTQSKINKFQKFFEENGVEFSYKIDIPDPEVDTTSKASRKDSSSSTTSRTEEDTIGVLEIDESEDEIQFKTPPQVKKVLKKSLNSPATPSNYKSIVKKEGKIKKAKGKASKNLSKGLKEKVVVKESKNVSKAVAKLPEEGKKVKSKAKGIGRKLEKKTEGKESKLTKSFKAKRKEGEKMKSAEKVVSIIKQKKGAVNENFKLVAAKDLKKNKVKGLKENKQKSKKQLKGK